MSASLTPAPSGQPKVWLDFRDLRYTIGSPLWRYATDHYTGDLLNEAKIRNYLLRRANGESELAYAERVGLADYRPFFSVIADSLAGMLAAVESDANRIWYDEDTKKGLGDPDTDGTISNRLIRDADGRGSSWDTMWKRQAIELTVNHTCWIAVGVRGQTVETSTDETTKAETQTRVGGRGILTLYPSLAVVNTWEDDTSGATTAVLTCEVADLRGSIRDEPVATELYKLFELTGWSTWKKDDQGKPVLLDEGTYAYVDRYGNPTLPIYEVKLPMTRPVGYLLAKIGNAIFNQQSQLDTLLRYASFPYLNLIGEDADIEKLVSGLAGGDKALQNLPTSTKTHDFIAPDSTPATAMAAILEKKIQEFFVAGFREYGNASRQKTATESKQDIASGVGAFLQLLKAGIDEAENTAMWLLAQTELKNSPDCWGVPHVERSDDFAPQDILTALDNLGGKSFGTTARIPMGRTARIAAAKQAAGWLGLTTDDQDLEADVIMADLKEQLDMARDLPIPAVMKAPLAVLFGQALGIVAITEGQEFVKLDPAVVLAAASALGEALDTDRMLLAQDLNSPAYPGTGETAGTKEFDPAAPMAPGETTLKAKAAAAKAPASAGTQAAK